MAGAVERIGQSEMSQEEWATRLDLAALYRLYVIYGWTDLTFTHITARVPGEPEHYLINPYGLLFDEITASSLIKADYDGNVISGDYPINEAGHLIHTAVLKARPDINFVLHSHTRAGCAVAAMTCGLLPVSQHAGLLMGQVTQHPYGLVTDEAAECDAIAADLGDKYLQIMENHGLLACGRTACEAFMYLYYLEVSCKIQVDLLQSGAEPIHIKEAAVAGLVDEGNPGADSRWEAHWPAMIRQVERKHPDYKN